MNIKKSFNEVTENPLINYLSHHAVEEGVTQTAWPGLILAKSSQPISRFSVLYKPSVCVVVQGRKCAYVGDQRFVYDPLHYLIVGLPLPLEAEILEASEEKPFYVLSLEIDFSMLGKLLLEIAEVKPEPSKKREEEPAICTTPMDEKLSGSFERLLALLGSPTDLKIIGSGIVKEILYRLLQGDQSTFLRSLVNRDSSSQRISQVVRYLQDNYHQPLNVSSIAKYAGMASSTLHHLFEKVTGQSPIQYLKKIRLHQAREMIVSRRLNASEAAYEVGYNNVSQFSREFKRQFNLPPSRAFEII
ncbi:MAG: AraC family transcriptional regulator [Proteobacteria bacterium]|nr:AraC family transcriptional regulator [Pseudomonadota bacterium]